jgi:glycosyltransferase involved in cell wall biosynthesis
MPRVHRPPPPDPVAQETSSTGRIRILRIIARLNVGGPALQASVLREGMDSTRFEERLLVGRVGAGEGDYLSLRAPDLPVVTIPGLGRAPNALADARAFRQLQEEIRRFRPHIVHTHTAKAGVLGRLAAWVGQVPATVHTFHGHLLHGYFSASKTKAVVLSERALALRTTRLVAVGHQVRDELLAAGIGKPAQFVIVPPGVRLSRRPDPVVARRTLDLPDKGPVVAFVGRLTSVKRPERFIGVALALADRHPSVTFIVVGDGDLLSDLQARSQPLGSRMRFLGWRGDVENVYAAADVVVLTSDNEGMPVSLIEAGLSGKPAVTTLVGSAAEVVADGVTGLVSRPTVEALAAAVDLLLADAQLRRSMGAAAEEHAGRHFGASRLIADIEGLYETITSEKRLAL